MYPFRASKNISGACRRRERESKKEAESLLKPIGNSLRSSDQIFQLSFSPIQRRGVFARLDSGVVYLLGPSRANCFQVESFEKAHVPGG